MGLRIHRADHPEALVGALCDLVASPLADPFAAEVVVVPTRGIERWLVERIAAGFAERGVGDGISANISFPFPHTFVADVLSAVPDMAPSTEAWSRRAVVARLEHLIDEHRDDDWMWLIARFVAGPDGDGSDGAQRLRAAQKIQRLFASYGRHRPAMLDSWTADEDVGPTGNAIADAAEWQPKLWRVLHQQIDVPAPHEALPAALDALRAGAGVAELPSRISVYGATSLDPMELAVFEAISSSSDVHLFLLHPSPALWQDSAGAVGDMGPDPVSRAEDPTRDIATHPLLRSWAQNSRELQFTIAGASGADNELAATSDSEPTSLLGALQSDVRANRAPAESANADRSIQIHSCHGARRQVEVLRDAVLHLLNDDPTLEPRDIVIMTPDLETFAPLIDAVFPAKSSNGSGIPDLRVRIADRGPARTNGLVRFVGTLVELAASRLAASDVGQLIALPEVQRHLRIDLETADEMAKLVKDANVRWGLDGDHRQRNGAGPRDEHTWRRGIDRVLSGVFFDDDPLRVFDELAPVTGVEGDSAVAAGRLALLMERITAAVELLNTESSAEDWADKLSAAVRLLAAPKRDDEWQWAQLDRLLNETFVADNPEAAGSAIDLAEVALLIAPLTEDRPSRLHHRTGNVTVCTLAPMRSVPYRIVCVVGMDHDKFPRQSRHDGDNLLADNEMIGDPDRAAQDRQLLLDALMAAGDNFIVTYAGRDQLTNAEYPPAVPIAELRETVAGMVGKDAADEVLTKHPLQGFSPNVFTPGELGIDGPWGFDPISHAGAVALSARDPEPSDAVRTLDAIDAEPPTLHELIAYLKNPSATFLKNSLGMYIPGLEDAPEDKLPTDLNGLERWAVHSRLLAGIQSGTDPDKLLEHERAADMVPAGRLADDILDDAFDRMDDLARAAADHGCVTDSNSPITGTVEGDDWTLSGSVVADPNTARIIDVSPSKAKADRRLALYAQVLFLSALDPERAWHGVMIGTKKGTPGKKDPRDYRIVAVTIGPVGETADKRAEQALKRLGELVALRNEGMTTPLPIFPESSYAFTTANNPAGGARGAWEGVSFINIPGERDDGAVRILFPNLVSVDDLLDSDFPTYATRLWSPILQLSEDETI